MLSEASAAGAPTAKTAELARDLREVLDPSPVTVHVRCRPEVKGDQKLAEAAGARGSAWSRLIPDPVDRVITVEPGPAAAGLDPVQFGFDAVIGAEAGQEEVFQTSAAALVEHAVAGLNTALFAYGPSGTGKTFTLVGDLSDPGRVGVVPRAVMRVFAALEEEAVPASGREVRFECLEIYNEQLTDLLWKPARGAGAEARPPTLRIAEDPVRGAVCIGLTSVVMDHPADVISLLRQATAASHRDATTLNRDSNRSHRLFFVTVARRRGLHELPRDDEARWDSGAVRSPSSSPPQSPTASGYGPPLRGRSRSVRQGGRGTASPARGWADDTALGDGAGAGRWDVEGSITLVDLAGSESVGRSQRSAAAGPVAAARQLRQDTEAGNINRSLLTLGRVISALANKERRVPYRDSKLTRLCSEALGGRCRTVILGTLAPARALGDDTRTALDFLARSKEALNLSQAPLTEQLALALARTRERLVFVTSELRRRDTFHDLEMRAARDEAALAERQAETRAKGERAAFEASLKEQQAEADAKLEDARQTLVEEARQARREATQRAEAAQEEAARLVQAARAELAEAKAEAKAKAEDIGQRAKEAAAERAAAAEAAAAAAVRAARREARAAVQQAQDETVRLVAEARREGSDALLAEQRRHRATAAAHSRALKRLVEVGEEVAGSADRAARETCERVTSALRDAKAAADDAAGALREAEQALGDASAAVAKRSAETGEAASAFAAAERDRQRERASEDAAAAATLRESSAEAESLAQAASRSARARLMDVMAKAIDDALQAGSEGVAAVAKVAAAASEAAVVRSRAREARAGREAAGFAASVEEWAAEERRRAADLTAAVGDSVARAAACSMTARDGAESAAGAATSGMKAVEHTVAARLRQRGAELQAGVSDEVAKFAPPDEARAEAAVQAGVGSDAGDDAVSDLEILMAAKLAADAGALADGESDGGADAQLDDDTAPASPGWPGSPQEQVPLGHSGPLEPAEHRPFLRDSLELPDLVVPSPPSAPPSPASGRGPGTSRTINEADAEASFLSAVVSPTSRA